MGGLVTLSVESSEASTVTPSDQRVGWALRDVRGVAFDSTGSLWFAFPQDGCTALGAGYSGRNALHDRSNAWSSDDQANV